MPHRYSSPSIYSTSFPAGRVVVLVALPTSPSHSIVVLYVIATNRRFCSDNAYAAFFVPGCPSVLVAGAEFLMRCFDERQASARVCRAPLSDGETGGWGYLSRP